MRDRTNPLVPHVWLVCSGLEHARRGYESFARECFDALRAEPGVRLELIKGSGSPRAQERVIRAARRDRVPARLAGRAIAVPPFRVEALSFAGSLAPAILRARPDVVYVSEWDTARALAWSRRLTRRRFRLLLCNGGFASEGFEHLDRVQELTPAARDYVVSRGADPDRHTVLPLGFAIAPALRPLSRSERASLRDRLGLPRDRPIVLSVAALNHTHKRLDALIAAVAQLERPRPYLLMAGEPDSETPGVRALAEERLGSDGYDMRTVPADAVSELYRASDTFVLASTAEMQGRALVEAAAHGLPCLAHDNPVMRFAVGEHGRYGDLTDPGALTALLAAQLRETEAERASRAAEAHRLVFERFSWDRLRPRYVALLRDVASANSTVSSSSGE